MALTGCPGGTFMMTVTSGPGGSICVGGPVNSLQARGCVNRVETEPSDVTYRCTMGYVVRIYGLATIALGIK